MKTSRGKATMISNQHQTAFRTIQRRILGNFFQTSDEGKVMRNFMAPICPKDSQWPEEGFLSWTSGVSDNSIYPEPWRWNHQLPVVEMLGNPSLKLFSTLYLYVRFPFKAELPLSSTNVHSFPHNCGRSSTVTSKQQLFCSIHHPNPKVYKHYSKAKMHIKIT